MKIGTLLGEADSIFESADSLLLKLNQLPLVRSDFHETSQNLKCIESCFFISAIKVKIWQIFKFYNANWNPRP